MNQVHIRLIELDHFVSLVAHLVVVKSYGDRCDLEFVSVTVVADDL